jgi:hypothetical protein
VVSGLKTADKIYLAVWCLGGEKRMEISLDITPKAVKIAYPSSPSAVCKTTQDGIVVEFIRSQAAVFLEIDY